MRATGVASSGPTVTGDGFPDVWEAEQTGNIFYSENVKPVTGDAELIAVNPSLTNKLMKADQGFPSIP